MKVKKIGLFVGIAIVVVVLAAATSVTVLLYSNKLPIKAAQGTSTPSEQAKEFGPIVETGEYTVNLGESNFLKLQVSLELTDKKAEEKSKEVLPVIRNQVIDVIAAKKFEDIKNPSGKEKLRTEIQEKINSALGQHVVKSVLFTNYVYQ